MKGGTQVKNSKFAQEVSTLTSSVYSDKFGVSNGVRQGSVASPDLFFIYLDTLLLALKKPVVGCTWSEEFARTFTYADNIVLLTPSLAALRLMLEKCQVFASSHGLIFNPGKTQFIQFHQRSCLKVEPNLLFCGCYLPLLDEITHLGHLLATFLMTVTFVSRVETQSGRHLPTAFPYIGMNCDQSLPKH